MISRLAPAESDPLWALTTAFAHDQREEKIDLVVGVYRDAEGKTPVMQAVQDAEARLAASAASKSYRCLSGNLEFIDGISRFLLGPDSPVLDRQCTIQTVGGTGALRLLADFIPHISPGATAWISDPGYVNHHPIMSAAGLKLGAYRWQEQEHDHSLDLAAAMEDLAEAQAGDVLLLHGCCHNPSGIDPTLEHWQAFSDLCREKKLIPLVDIAYQGFGDGIEEDAAGLRLMAREHELMLVVASCSKNMGLYCERTGAAMIIAPDAKPLENIRFTLERIARANYSMPPDHGSSVAAMLFQDPEPWLAELEACRRRVADIRRDLANELLKLGAAEKFQSLRYQKGMFSLLPITPAQMDRLRQDFGIYGTTSCRINIAGLASHQTPAVAKALLAVS
ncbi:aspartate/tyrosine/aromatic aminotransferase [Verrucomicrobiaceae bacterium R5-34]|nr:aspartate/tyrosine/aromatic aminotransferase [Verrucomicrobiaceae bacterium R5-34]